MSAISTAPLRVESSVKVENKLMSLTQAEEDTLYGSIDEFISQVIDSLKAKDGLFRDEHDKLPRSIDLVWEGWDAAFIRSKGDDDWPVATLESTGLHVVLGEHLKKVFRKRKLKEFSLLEKTNEEAEVKSLGIPSDTRQEFAVTLLAYQVLKRFESWPELESLIGPICGDIRKRVFDCAVKLILIIFDEEDYYRICYWFQIKREHFKFCNNCADKTTPLANLSLMKFYYLTEADVYEACRQLHAYKTEMSKNADEERNYSALKFRKECAFSHKFWMMFFKESDVPRAQKLMQKHRPLKGYHRAQLMLELSRSKCFHVTDTLILEAIKDLNLPEFYEKCKSGDSDASNQCQNLLLELADSVCTSLDFLTLAKADELSSAEVDLIGAPQCLFGTFKKEVLEVIKLANHERRMGNNHFTGLADIWSALSFSRVRDCLPEILSHYLCPELCLLDVSSSEIYTFRLYELSHHLASQLGDEEVGLEHLVFSIVYGSSRETLMDSYYEESKYQLFKRLQNCHSHSEVESWRNIDVFTTLLRKRSRFGIYTFFKGREVVDKLEEVAKTGRLMLPKYEELRVV